MLVNYSVIVVKKNVAMWALNNVGGFVLNMVFVH